MPTSEAIFARFQDAALFSKIDLKSAFNQIVVREQDRWLTAFQCPSGLFEFNVLPFGLKNAPAHMQATAARIIDVDRTEIYIDDVGMHDKVHPGNTELETVTNTLDVHAAHIRKVLTKLKDAKLFAKKGKDEWFVEETTFLGYQIEAGGRIAVSKELVGNLDALGVPKTLPELRSWIGLANWPRRFIEG